VLGNASLQGNRAVPRPVGKDEYSRREYLVWVLIEEEIGPNPLQEENK
jgi:hypothetical protein